MIPQLDFPSPPSRNYLQKGVALLLLASAVYAAIRFPVFPLSLTLGMLIYFCALLLSPAICLVVLPAAIAALDLTTLSGRILIDEFDYLMLVTFAGLLWRGCYQIQHLRLGRASGMVVGALSTIYLISFLRGYLPIDPLDSNALANYYSSYNSVRVGKGFFYALLLIPALATLAQFNVRRTFLYLLTGMCLSLIFAGLSVLWERGVLGDLVHAQSIYHLVDSIFDFSTRYRATALLSQMHTGGEAIDEFIALSWPFSLAGLFIFRKPLALAFSAIALVLALYTLTSTFSRATYLAGGAGAVVLLLTPFYAKTIAFPVWKKLLYLLCFATCIGVFLFTYAKGGMWALASSVTIFVSSALLGALFQHKSKIIYLSVGLSGLLGILLYHGFASSKWNENSTLSSFIFTASITTTLLFLGHMMAKQTPKLERRPFVLLVLIIGVVCAAGIPSTIGERMDTRFSEVNRDLQMRKDHWQDIRRSMNDGIVTTLFGMGLGTFPKNYLWSGTNIAEIGSYLFQSELYNHYLSLGGGSFLFLGQKIDFQPNQRYKLSLKVRNQLNKGRFVARICHRHILEPAQANTQCVEASEVILPTGDEWLTLTFDIESDTIGVKQWYQGKPTTFGLYFGGKDAQLDIDEVVLEDEMGFNLIRNGSFDHGGDHWLSYNDIDHLPWHIKNLWLNLYYELGVLGLFGVVAALCLALYQLFVCARSGNPFAPALGAALVGFMTVGLFGSFDVPRNIWLFYLIIFTVFVTHAHCKPDQTPN